MDGDSQNEGATAIMSGLETESESDVHDEPEDNQEQETPYVHLPEEEFGAVSFLIQFFFLDFFLVFWILYRKLWCKYKFSGR